MQLYPMPGIGFLALLGIGCVLLNPPALITGLVAGWLVGRVRWAVWMRAAALVGAGVSFLALCLVGAIVAVINWGAWTNGPLSFANVGAAVFASVLFGALGAAAAWVSAGFAWVLLMATRLSPDRPATSPPA